MAAYSGPSAPGHIDGTFKSFDNQSFTFILNQAPASPNVFPLEALRFNDILYNPIYVRENAPLKIFIKPGTNEVNHIEIVDLSIVIGTVIDIDRNQAIVRYNGCDLTVPLLMLKFPVMQGSKLKLYRDTTNFIGIELLSLNVEPRFQTGSPTPSYSPGPNPYKKPHQDNYSHPIPTPDFQSPNREAFLDRYESPQNLATNRGIPEPIPSPHPAQNLGRNRGIPEPVPIPQPAQTTINSMPGSTKTLEEYLTMKIANISNVRLPISSLHLYSQYSSYKINITNLRSHYSAFRRVADDSKSSYRCIGICYLEHLFRYSTDISELDDFISKLSMNDVFRPHSINQFSRPRFINFLQAMRQKKISGLNCIEKFTETALDPGFDDDLVAEIKCLVLNAIDQFSSLANFQSNETESPEALKHRIQNEQIELSSAEFRYLSEILKVCIILKFININDTYYIYPDNPVGMPIIHILNSTMQYDIIYTYDQMVADKYDPNSHSFMKTELHHIELLACKDTLYLSQDKYSQIQNESKMQNGLFDKIVNYCTGLQEFVMDLTPILIASNQMLSIEELKKLPSVRNFTSYLTTFSRLDYSSSEIEPIVNKEYQLISLFDSKDARVYLYRLCQICNQNASDVELKCKHAFCRYDLQGLVLESTSNYVVFSPYESAQSVICPACSAIIDEETIKIIFPEDIYLYYEYNMLNRKQDQMRSLGLQECQACKNIVHINSILPSHPCFCYDCQAKSLLNNQASCQYCQLSFSRLDSNELEARSLACTSCGEFYQLKSLKLALDCHIMCNSCLEASFNNSKCTVCEKDLSPEEVMKFVRLRPQCLECMEHKVFDAFKSGKVCDCMVCAVCVKNLENGGVKNCKICDTVFRKTYTCMCCQNAFESLDGMRSHEDNEYFCEICIMGYLEYIIKAPVDMHMEVEPITDEGITCPNHLCKSRLNGHMVQSLVTPELWDMMNRRLIERKYTMSRCPRCEERFEYVNQISRCPNAQCKFRFCVICYEAEHIGDCEKNTLMNIIAALQAAGTPCAQCPGCQKIYGKDDKCEHVRCVNPACGIDFCFKCACIRSPTMVHGNHYHRPGCVFFADYNGPDDFKPDKCTECRKKGVICDRPGQLPNQPLFT